MCTGRSLMGRVLPDLELDGRALLPAVADVALAGDPVGLPVVGAGRVEPERREVEELRLELEAAVPLLGLIDHRLVAEDPVAVLLVLLADVDPQGALAVDLALEDRRGADGYGRAGLGRGRRDAVLGRCLRRRGADEERGRAGREDDHPVHARDRIRSRAGMRTAVVDIGTNSTRLLVADVEPGGELREIVRESLVTRLGDGLEAGRRLRPDARERVLGVVERYARVVAEHDAERALAVMTSAVRDAADGAD